MLVDQFGRPMKPVAAPEQVRQVVRARYDAERSQDEHWANADSLSARTANSYSVRKRLRERSRYEVANNSYASGIVSTLANYTVGHSVNLQLIYHGDKDSETMRLAAKKVEKLWSNWAYVRKLGQKLQTMCMASIVDGEAFARFGTATRRSMLTPVELEVTPFESDQFEDITASGWISDDAGVRIDNNGEPTAYAFLKEHPGDRLNFLSTYDQKWLPADSILHVFKKDRPQQLRGVPRTTPALPLFAYLRRYTLASVDAAESAASIAAILYGDQAVAGEAQPAAWDNIPLPRGSMLTVGGGQRIAQVKSEQPITNYEVFVRALLREIARCLSVPLILAAQDSSKSNFASSKVDLISFSRQIEVERTLMWEQSCLDRIYEQWLDEGLLIDDFLPAEFIAEIANFEWRWVWSGGTATQGVNRAQDATGAATELASLTTSLAHEWGQKGVPWEDALRQIARERSLMAELGLQIITPTSGNQPNNEPDDDTSDEPVEDEELADV